jgi:hypothetical protein
VTGEQRKPWIERDAVAEHTTIGVDAAAAVGADGFLIARLPSAGSA